MNLQRGFLISVILALLFVTVKMLEPFLGYLLGTLVLGFVLYPLQKRLSPRVGERASALLIIIFTLLAVIIPFALTVNAAIDDAQNLDIDLNETQYFNSTELEEKIEDYTGRNIDIEQEIERVLENFTSSTIGSVSRVLNILTNVSIGLSISLFVLYYLLKDGSSFKAWLIDTTPIPENIQEELYQETNETTWAVVKGHVLVALIQGLIAGLGLYLVGIDNYAFWTFIMILLAFIPIIGAFIVWGPAGFYLIALGRTSAGIFLLLWGAVIVGLTDNFLRPLLVDRGSKLHPAVILIGVIGGIYVFGAAGIFMGPVTLGVLKSALEVFKENYEEL